MKDEYVSPHKSDDPRCYTAEEVQTQFLQYLWTLVDYYNEKSRVTDTREKLAGLAFSFLCTLDGVTEPLPAFEVFAAPHEDDKACCQREGENWFPRYDEKKGKKNRRACITDSMAMLHDLWHELDPRKETK